MPVRSLLIIDYLESISLDFTPATIAGLGSASSRHSELTNSEISAFAIQNATLASKEASPRTVATTARYPTLTTTLVSVETQTLACIGKVVGIPNSSVSVSCLTITRQMQATYENDH